MLITEFDKILQNTHTNIRRVLEFVPPEIKLKCEEIRLRAGLPVCLTIGGEVAFVCKNSKISNSYCDNCLIITSEELNQTLSLLCNNSIYIHENEIKNGYISLKNGNRAGVCGVFNAEGMLVYVTSINIRIARQIFDCALTLALNFDGVGMLIVGPPGCGKTTMLRDLIRLLSCGKFGKYQRVTVIDSRGEISGGISDKTVNDLGENTDVLYMQNKALGTEIALRTMYPNVIAFDEIATEKELKSVCSCFNAGVGIIVTAHCRDKKDIMQRKITSQIIKSGAVSKVALLSEPGVSPQLFDVKELLYCACN